MHQNPPIVSPRLAVLIDAENVSQSLIDPTLKMVAECGPAKMIRIYGDWSKPQLAGWKDKLTQFAIHPIQQFSYVQGKNASDIALIIDAMDQLHSRNFDSFCLVSSDSDFIPLACRLRQSGIKVYGVGENKTPEPFRCACDEFLVVESTVQVEDHPNAQKAAREEYRNATTPDGKPDLATTPTATMAESPGEASQGLESDENIRRFCVKLKKVCDKIGDKVKKMRKSPPNEAVKKALGVEIVKLLTMCAEAPTVCDVGSANSGERRDADPSSILSDSMLS